MAVVTGFRKIADWQEIVSRIFDFIVEDHEEHKEYSLRFLVKQVPILLQHEVDCGTRLVPARAYSTATVKKALDVLVEAGMVARVHHKGQHPTYRLLQNKVTRAAAELGYIDGASTWEESLAAVITSGVKRGKFKNVNQAARFCGCSYTKAKPYFEKAMADKLKFSIEQMEKAHES